MEVIITPTADEMSRLAADLRNARVLCRAEDDRVGRGGRGWTSRGPGRSQRRSDERRRDRSRASQASSSSTAARSSRSSSSVAASCSRLKASIPRSLTIS